MIVLDASAAVDYLCPSAGHGAKVSSRIADEAFVHAPSFFDLEVLNAVRGLERSRQISTGEAQTAVTDLEGFRVVHHDHEGLRPRIWQLRHNLTAYDAAYVALAELLDATLLTSDSGLAKSRGHQANIELV